MTTPTRGPIQELVGSLLGNLRYPWVFALVLLLFVTDMVIPDPVPFVDEMMLALLTFLLGTWRSRRKAPTKPIDVTDQADRDKPTSQR